MSRHHIDLVETLNRHADQLSSGGINDTEYPQMTLEQRQEFLSLLRLAGQVKGALVPVGPSPPYRQKLALDLARMAQQRTNEGLRIALRSPRRDWLLGAAIGSAVAVVGGIAFLIRTRLQAESQHTSQAQS
jgi:hypothetical protein